MSRFTAVTLLAAVLTCPVGAQHYQNDFPPEEFAARWKVVFDRIGSNAVGVVQGLALTDGYSVPRQYNTFYYLSGIETPGAYLSFDGRTRRVTLYLPRRNEALERAEGKVLSAEDADVVKRLTGVDEVRGVDAMAAADWPIGPSMPGAQTRPALYAEFSRPRVRVRAAAS